MTEEHYTVFSKEEINQKLKNVFGFDTLRPFQQQVVDEVVKNKDLLVIAMTGGGKSLCYQLPAILVDGITIVISPLRSLIEDQYNNLLQYGISSTIIYGDIDSSTQKKIFNNMKLNKYSIVLTTPETFEGNTLFKITLDELYQTNKLNRIVIDEAHCISLWGHDFRPSYLKLATIKNSFPKVPFMALTASATTKVQKDIKYLLGMDDYKTIFNSFYRPNLHIEIKKKDGSPNNEIKNLLKNDFKQQSGIIYCLSRKKCETLSNKLNTSGLNTAYYHAGLDNNSRKEIQEKWKNNEIQVIIATIAFGMGIDKPDVRFVIHSDLPKSIEGYYQEIGRAGRDGKTSKCILFYSYQDKIVLEKMIRSNNETNSKKELEYQRYQIQKLNEMIEFLNDIIDCRHYRLCNYFGENNIYQCHNCDNCNSNHLIQDTDVTKEASSIIQAISTLNDDSSRSNIKRYVLGKWNIYKNNIGYGSFTSDQTDLIERLIIYLIIQKYIKEDFTRSEEGLWKDKLKMYKKSKLLLQENCQQEIIIPTIKMNKIQHFFPENDPSTMIKYFEQYNPELDNNIIEITSPKTTNTIELEANYNQFSRNNTSLENTNININNPDKPKNDITGNIELETKNSQAPINLEEMLTTIRNMYNTQPNNQTRLLSQLEKIIEKNQPIPISKDKTRYIPKIYTDNNLKLKQKLNHFRKTISEQQEIKIYAVLSNRTIDEIIDKQPSNLEDLKIIYGLGELKIKKYGQHILDIITNLEFL